MPAEVWISLGTAAYNEALTRIDDARQEALRRFSAPIQPPSPTGIYSRTIRPTWPQEATGARLRVDDARPLAQDFFRRAMQGIDLEIAPADWDDVAIDVYREELRDRYQRLVGPEAENEIDEIEGALVAVLQRENLSASPLDEATLLLRQYLRRAMAQAASIRLARFDGDHSDDISDAMFKADFSGAAHFSDGSFRSGPDAPEIIREAKSLRRSEATLGGAMDRYLAEVLDLRGVTEKTSQKHRSLLNHVASFFGRDTPICDIERADCNRFRNTLAKLPPNFSKGQKAKGRSLEQIANANRAKRTLSWETQNNYLKMMDDMMGWALKERLVPDNVASDIPPLTRREAAEKKRLPFGQDELASIFSQPLFTGCVDDERGYAKSGPNIVRRSRYWLPLVALYSGMRMGEILHLTTDHVRLSRAGNPFIVLTPDMRLKTDSAEREIPIHPMLLRLGFFDWVEDRRRSEKLDLFDDVPDGRHGYRSDIFTKRFATFLRRVKIPAERRTKLCFHSFRHTFKDALNATGAPETEMEEICGWSRGKRTSRRYGTGFDAERLKPYVDQVNFDIDLEPLVSTWR